MKVKNSNPSWYVADDCYKVLTNPSENLSADPVFESAEEPKVYCAEEVSENE
jgi:hypothetical protein